MAKRHRDALIVSDGASNPIAVANAIAAACREVQDEKGSTADDSAIQLMVYQLVHLTNTKAIEPLTAYRVARTICEERRDA